jgi:hypothetical protein
MANQQIIFRISPAHRTKLKELMAKTGRSQTKILELLLEQAVAANEPDIRLVGCELAGDPHAAA